MDDYTNRLFGSTLLFIQKFTSIFPHLLPCLVQFLFSESYSFYGEFRCKRLVTLAAQISWIIVHVIYRIAKHKANFQSSVEIISTVINNLSVILIKK